MTNPGKLVLAGLLVILSLAPLATAFADVPLLKWERGQVQQVVLGGVAAENNWKIQLQGNGITPLGFQVSEKAPGGYLVYSLMIPIETPRGPYLIVAIKNSGEIKVVSTIILLGTNAYKVTAVPKDLAFIVGIFVFITAIISTIRSRKYSQMSFLSTQTIPVSGKMKVENSEPLVSRITSLPYRTRVMSISGFETSLAKFLLVREGELIHRISKNLYAYLPIAAFLGGLIAANETEKAGGIAKAGLVVFIVMAVICIADAYSGVLATLAFWLAELALGNISSLRDILIMLAVGIGWIGPIVGFSVIQSTVGRDFKSVGTSLQSPWGSVAVLLAGPVFGSSIFFLGQKLINSILIEFEPQREISFLALGVIAIAIFIRGLADGLIENERLQKVEGINQSLESITIARVSSLQTFTLVAACIFGFSYLWTKNAQSSAIITALFSSPYALLLIRFDTFSLGAFSKIPRNVLVEAVLVTALAVYLFRDISTKPLLVDVMSRKFLILAGFPALAHAIYSLMHDTADRIERVQA